MIVVSRWVVLQRIVAISAESTAEEGPPGGISYERRVLILFVVVVVNLFCQGVCPYVSVGELCQVRPV